MSYHFEVQVQCDECGRFETMHWGDSVSRSAARANAKRRGWVYDQKAKHHTCPDCVKRQTTFTLTG